MQNKLLMPKATAVWLIDNTSLSFAQIAKFCKLHLLEVKAIADGEAAQGIKGLNPVMTGQLTREEITKGERDSRYVPRLAEPRVYIPEKKRRSPRYTPLSKRQDRPNAILWLLQNYPELKHSQISHLVGTTKSTIEQIHMRTHWNSANLVARDPVTLGLCSQIDLDTELRKITNDRLEIVSKDDETLLPASATENFNSPLNADSDYFKTKNKPDVDRVFSKLEVQAK